ncbi:uncharacterized protein SPAPADRAFT_131507 [Spathaspora passalidarum NRRL Y-27907]|uniref:Dolichol-phosphate mannosyltransferase subunit 3 n=1 Tax=Spathaspora passalidarum (strain NRRL Y-27907 / 11-Y1) TaxID=619300 RepID=G3AFX4_SPAPN|nr:uncharacterized protein SPAPADRAFT_131507 [Spathaspora passalidarum NRRL Y-27907]EGW35113.1 hypothetical protein SPAPADRAFT_131507 [Spathaspora passalidarum NRRL Y-27907]
MTKATDAALTLYTLVAIYFASYVGIFPLPQKVHDEILPYLPFWGLVTFGSYALATLGWGIVTFKDKEDKYKELVGQIDEAKQFYKSKGIELD